MRYVFVILSALFMPVLAAAQPPDSLWSRTFGTSAWEECWSVQQTADEGYILGGYTESYGAGDKDFWLIKTDVNGTEEWNRTFGGSSADFCYSVQQTTDGGFILGGYTESFGAGNKDFWLVKTDANGDSLWSRTFGGAGQDWCYSAQRTSDGGYVLAGLTDSYGAGGRDFWLVKTNANGDSLWSRTFGGISFENCYSLQQTADGGYVLGGNTTTFGVGNSDFWLVRTDANGDSLWSRTFGGSDIEVGWSIQQTADGGYIFGGYTESFGAGNNDFWLVKTNANGDSVWSRSYGGSGDDYCHTLQQTSDGGYILGGYTYSFGAGATDYWMVRTNANGDSLWGRTFGGYSYDRGISLQQTADYGYIFGGYTQSFGEGARDFWIVKTGPDPVTNELSGSLSGTIGPGEYHIVGDISIQPSDTLTLMPGTVFHFDSLYEFYISGTLLAEGMEGDSIVFTTDTTANPDRWRGLRFNGASSSGGRLAYCLIENAHRTGGMPNNYGGGIYCTSSSPTFTHCVIRNNTAERGGAAYCTYSSSTFTNCSLSGNLATNHGGGVYCDHSSITFTSCLFDYNQTTYGGGVYCQENSSLDFANCTFIGNSASHDGGGVLFNSSTATLTDCIISDNTSSDDGGGVYCVGVSSNFTNCTISGNAASNYGGGFSLRSNSALTLTDCDIYSNSAHSDGGGLYCNSASVDMTDCTIRGNQSTARYGGGVCCQYSSATFANCTIDSNYADRDGGGLNFSYDCSATVTDCIIRNNTALSEGGGAYCYEESSPIFTNCTFSGNTAHTQGGGAYIYEASPTFTTCIFTDNSAYQSGGGVNIAYSSATFARCTISENSAPGDGGGVHIVWSSPTVNSTVIAFSEGEGIFFSNSAESEIKYCDIFGNSEGDIVFYDGNPSHGPTDIGELVTTNANNDSSDVYYNILLDPMFVDTMANDYHLLEGSPCIDAGDPTLLPDPDGTVVEIGALHFPQEPSSYSLSPDSLDFGEVVYRGDSTLSFWIHNHTQDILYAAGIRVTDTLIFHANPTSAQIPPDDSVEIELTFTPRRNIAYLDSVQISFAWLDEMETVVVQGTGIYDCHVLDGAVSGTLSMDCNPYYVAGTTTLADDDTLVIDAGVEVIFDSYCQFIVNGLLLAMGTEQDSIYFTCDTLFNPDHWGGIRFVDAHDSCHLEYCVIEYGRAEGDYPNSQGGGLLCGSSSPTFAHCMIRDNWSEDDGGGVFCYGQSSPTFISCTVRDNVSGYYGGGVYCSGSPASLTNCLITGNTTPQDGGGLQCSHCSPTVTNCTISGNSAGGSGGGIDLYGSSSAPVFNNCTIVGNSTVHNDGGGLNCSSSASAHLNGCTISGNTAADDGGGFCGSYSSSSFVGCAINNNSAADQGGGVYSSYGSLIFTECTIIDNASDDHGGGVFIREDTLSTFTHCTISGNASGIGGGVYFSSSSPTFNSTIVAFSDGEGIFFNLSPQCVFEYCDVYGNTVANIGFVDDDPSHGPAGIGELTMTNANGDSCDAYYNISLNPMFVDTAASDYHVLTGSPCIDAGDPDLPLDPDGTIADIGAFYFESHPPSPFNLLSPANGDTVDTLAVVFTWEASSDPDPGDSIAFYQVYLALDSAFTTGLDSQDVATNELTWDDLTDGQTYWWRVKAFDTQDNGTYSNQTWNFTSVASAISGEDVLLPSEFALYQNYPNPFNPTTVIRYDVKQTGLVSLKIFDILGREVTTLVHGTIQAGSHTISWDASGLPSGVYLCRMEAPSFEHTMKLVLLK